mgnify:CR=1 FL=1
MNARKTQVFDVTYFTAKMASWFQIYGIPLASLSAVPGELQLAEPGDSPNSVTNIQEKVMALLTTALAASTGTAAGFSLVYLLAGGGILGAGLIFLVAKML